MPCDGCTACCRSPVLDRGDLPRAADGSCGHLVDGKCLIYAERPLACRVYDCRLASLLGIMPANDQVMMEAHQQWARFKEPTVDDTDMRVAIRLGVAATGSTDLRQATAALRTWPQHLDRAREMRRVGMAR